MVRVAARPATVLAGLIGDRFFGEPAMEPHPVSALGSLMRATESRLWRDSMVAGSFHAAAGTAAGLLAGCGLARLGGTGVAFATYLAVAGRSLADTARSVAVELEAGDLARARCELRGLVGRDVEGLDEKEIVRAVVESVAENTVDAVVAPLLWAIVAGAPGATAYRAVNTLDAMVGHRTARYGRYGWASARLDDLAGWLPARLTAGLVALVRPRHAAEVWRTVRRDAGTHPSPNAGVAEAAFAAGLGVRLGGENHYGGEVEIRGALGEGGAPEAPDIERALQLADDVSLAVAFGLGLASALPWVRCVAGRLGRRVAPWR